MVLHSFILHKSMFQMSSQSVVYYVFDSNSKWASSDFKKMKKLEIRAVIQYSYLTDLSATQIKIKLDLTTVKPFLAVSFRRNL